MADSAPRTLTELFDRSVRKYPDRPAVTDGTQSLTYAQLDREAGIVAASLRRHGVGREDRVGVYLSRSTGLFAGILGALKAGAVYVAVDLRYPDARRDFMLESSGAKVVLTDRHTRDRLGELAITTVDVDEPAESGEAADAEVRPGDAASLLFTSGSSGEPKGIVLEHRNLVSFAENPALPALLPEDRVGQVSSVSFDAFHFEMWCALAAGARTVVLPPVPELLAGDFQRQMKHYGITAMLVPTMVVNHVVREDRDAFSSLRILATGGDVLTPAACRALLGGRFKGELYNLYGPAEITTACTSHRVSAVDADSEAIPIGRPLRDVSLRILSPELQPVADGAVGELYVGGPGVARGYFGRDDLTAERFATESVDGREVRMYRTGDLVRRREDGTLLFVGRADGQVKIRGYRIEPGEVERSLMRFAEVHDAIVLPAGSGDDRRLVAFVVVEESLGVKDLRHRAEAHLPDFMVPAKFIVRPEIPATTHGKRDMDALRELLADHLRQEQAYAAPETGTEKYLAELWEELLSAEKIGRNAEFFELGGHSLLAFRMHHRICGDLGAELEFPAVLAHPVLKDLALVIDTAPQREAKAS
ncbi:non-ribosomal peptide synthetase [Nonomuraea sp. NPDC059007]|uniref:non-ribosomal peptide synthetase n=1 Tax=Nonomuraea sp. NPDC059007 TaxID=3346692 RepID=UPI0036B8DE59